MNQPPIVGSGVQKREYRRRGQDGTERAWTRWIGWVDFGKDDFGKRSRPSRSFEFEGDAKRWVKVQVAGGLEAERQRRRGGGGPTFGDVLDAWYQEGVDALGWSPRHASVTKRLLDGDLHYLRVLPLARVTVEHAQDAIAAMVRAKRSPHSIRRAKNVLSAALNFAIRRRQLPPGYNVASLVRIPTIPAPAPRYLEQEHLAAFFAAVAGDRMEAMFKVTLALGLRPGEAIGLRWGDVDLDGARVTVQHTTQQVDGRIHDRGTKTGRARVVHLPAGVVELLRLHLAGQPRPLRLAGARVFPNTGGGALNETYANRRLHVLVDRWNRTRKTGTPALPRVTFYELRHTAATLLLSLGVPIEQVQEILGHSTIVITRKYAHVVERSKRESAEVLDRYLSGLPFGAEGGTTGGTTAQPDRLNYPDRQ